jgi:hypothetical protein
MKTDGEIAGNEKTALHTMVKRFFHFSGRLVRLHL